MIHQQKERFKHKYRKGITMLEKNKSLDTIDRIGSDGNAKDDSLHLDPLVNPHRVAFNKTKIQEEGVSEPWIEKRKGLSTAHQQKRKRGKNTAEKVGYIC